MPLPLGFQRRHVDNDAAAGVGGFAQADGEHVARYAEVLHRAGQGEGVGRDDADVTDHVHEAVLHEILGVYRGGVDIGKYLEFAGTAHVVPVAGRAV